MSRQTFVVTMDGARECTPVDIETALFEAGIIDFWTVDFLYVRKATAAEEEAERRTLGASGAC